LQAPYELKEWFGNKKAFFKLKRKEANQKYIKIPENFTINDLKKMQDLLDRKKYREFVESYAEKAKMKNGNECENLNHNFLVFSLKYNFNISAIFRYFSKSKKSDFLWFAKKVVQLRIRREIFLEFVNEKNFSFLLGLGKKK
jgi:hypothetical protein